MAVIAITDETFEAEVLNSPLPVLIDFYADWCGPCKQVAPMMEQVATEHYGRIKVVKVDVERAPHVAEAFQVQSIPTIVLLDQRQLVDRVQGAVPKSVIDEMIAKVASLAPGGVETWEVERCVQELQAGAVPLDVRAATDFARTHLPGAMSVPADKLAEIAATLPRGRYVLYARTDEGVRELADQINAAGNAAAVLKGGLLAWEVQRLPIERGLPS